MWKDQSETSTLQIIRPLMGIKTQPSLQGHDEETSDCWNPILQLNISTADLDIVFPSADHQGLGGRQGWGGEG